MPQRLFAIVLLAAPLAVSGQPPNDDCASASLLCAEQTQPATNIGAVGPAGFCPGTDNVVWFTFTTNSVGGPVTVSLTDIDCLAVPGNGNALSLVVLDGDGSCQPGSFSAVSTCAGDSLAVSVTTVALMPSTQYWVVVGGLANNGAVQEAECDMQIVTGGPGAVIINVDFDAGPDLEIGEGEVVQLLATGGTTYDWSPTSGLSNNTVPDPFASPTETTTYSVTTEIDGCSYTDQLVISVIRRISPPNTFTPNEDGINDTWTISGLSDYPDAEVDIYDRWGQKVFTSRGYREPWDGTRNGAKLPTATYYYHIDLNQLEGRAPPYTGSVTIVR